MRKIASISALEYDLGKSQIIDKLDFLINDPEQLEVYKQSGSKYYTKSKTSNIDLCINSIEKTLHHSSISKEKIDVVIYVSENATREYNINIIDVNNILLRVDLKKALPIGVSLSDCANIITGLQVGVSMVVSGMAENVLLVCSDVVTGKDGKRKMKRETAILSDGAVSCIISKPGLGDYDVCNLKNQNLTSLWEKNTNTHEYEYSMEKFKTIHRISRKILKESFLTPIDVKKVFTSNYSLSTMKLFVQMTGCTESQGYYENVESFGHTLAGDVLINLKDFHDRNGLSTGDMLLSVVDSYSTCGAMIFCKS